MSQGIMPYYFDDFCTERLYTVLICWHISAYKSRGVRGIDVCVQLSWQMLAGESPAVVKVGQPLSQ